ncbi:MAG: adenylyltransferase/cytidyltransferase family protein [Eubacteriales bacterium]|nr:adenylyltransferase/cytidyltransferase family protein [Eubacteriales bacterium]
MAIVGYTTGVFDLFHIGHLNILRRAKEQCDYLIVGVTVDELVSYKGKRAFIPYDERAAIVGAIRYVDRVVPQTTMNKLEAWKQYHFNKMFVGDDWKGTEIWAHWEKEFAKLGVDIVYFQYTKQTSSTQLREALLSLNKEKSCR